MFNHVFLSEQDILAIIYRLDDDVLLNDNVHGETW